MSRKIEKHDAQHFDVAGRLKRFIDILVGLFESDMPEIGASLLSFLAQLLLKSAIVVDSEQLRGLVLAVVERAATSIGRAVGPKVSVKGKTDCFICFVECRTVDRRIAASRRRHATT